MDLWTPAKRVLALPTDAKAATAAGYERAEPVFPDSPPYARVTHAPAAQHLRALGGTEAVDWIHDCVRLIAESVSAAEVYFEQNGKRIVDPEKRVKHDVRFRGLHELFHEPNPWVTWSELVELLVMDLMLVGNGYWLKFRPTADGRPVALYRLAPDAIEIEPGEDRLVKRYLYQTDGMKEPAPFEPHEIMHFKLPNPHDPIFGMGVIQGGPRAVDVEIGLTETMARYYEEGAKVPGVITTDRSVPEPVRKKIQKQWRAMYATARRSWQTPVLERGLAYQAIGSDAQHAAFEAMTRLGRDRIAALCHVPVPLLDGGAGGGNVVQAQEHFDNKTVRPFLRRLADVISRDLSKPWGIQVGFDYETVIPETDRIAAAGEFAKLPGVTVAEVRERAGLEPLGEAEIDDLVLNLPLPSTEGDDPNAGPDQPLPGEAGRPANPENTSAITPESPVPRVNGRSATPSDRRRMQRVAKQPLG